MLLQDIMDGINSDKAGLLAMQLMQQGRGNAQPSMGEQLFALSQGLDGLLKKKEPEAEPVPDYLQRQNIPQMSQQQPQTQEMANINPFPADRTARLEMLKRNAEQAYPNNPMMQQVAISQALLESGLLSNPSKLAMNNNLFGIKAPGTAGSVNMPTQEFMGGSMQNVNDNFGRNNSIADSFNQHRNLMNNKRYQPVIGSQNPIQAFNALESAGYATDPQYAEKLASIYNKYVAPLY